MNPNGYRAEFEKNCNGAVQSNGNTTETNGSH